MQTAQAIILIKQTMVSLGVKYILDEYFDVKSILIDSFATINEYENDKIDYFFVDGDSFIDHIDFFLPRKKKLIVVSERIKTDLQNHTLNICDDEAQIIEFIKYIIECVSDNDNNMQMNLSAREIDVLKLICSGNMNKEIAEKLCISFNTVLTHRKNITSKLGIKTISGLSLYAMMNGYIDCTK